MTKKAILLLSGGIDSSTMLAMVLEQGYQIYALSFNYSQRNNVELDKIKEFIKDYKVASHKIVNIDLRAFGGSALTDNNIDVPKYESAADLADDVPVTYVPARNTIFLSFALGWAEIIGANDIFIGAHSIDYANYPDCRPEFLKAFEDMANLATKSGISGTRINIHAPLLYMTKGDIIAAGTKLGVNYADTISCYNPELMSYHAAIVMPAWLDWTALPRIILETR